MLEGDGRTGYLLYRQILGSLFADKLWLVLSSIAKDLNQTCAIAPNRLVQLKSGRNVLFTSTTEDQTKRYAVLDTLCSSLSLI
jgi:hypothetical protein